MAVIGTRVSHRSKTISDDWRCSDCQSISHGRGYPICRHCRTDIKIKKVQRLPCPNCKERKELGYLHEGRCWQALCDSCGYRTMWMNSKQDSLEAWNERR